MTVTRWLGVALLAGCSTKPPSETRVTLDGQLVARVGDQGVSGQSVARAAQAQGISAREALERALSDALFANEARARGVDRSRRRELRQELVKALFGQLGQEARAEGPPTKAELDVHANERWLEVRRPESRAAVHAVVRLSEDADSATVARAQALAEKIRDALKSIADRAPNIEAPDLLPRPGLDLTKTDPVTTNVIATVDAIDTGGLKVDREQLPPIGVDGLSIQALTRAPYDPDFVAALGKLETRGAISPVFRSRFGLHVVVLLAKYPEKMLTEEQLAARFGDVVYATRARRKAEGLLETLRGPTSVDIEPAADNLMGLIEIKQ